MTIDELIDAAPADPRARGRPVVEPGRELPPPRCARGARGDDPAADHRADGPAGGGEVHDRRRPGQRLPRARQAGRRACGRPVVALQRRCAARRAGGCGACGDSTTRRPVLRPDRAGDGRRGQSEIEIAAIADPTVVVLNPGAGDAVQSAKAGLLEVADIVVVNKADREGADQTVRDLRAETKAPILKLIAARGDGIGELVEAIEAHARADSPERRKARG